MMVTCPICGATPLQSIRDRPCLCEWTVPQMRAVERLTRERDAALRAYADVAPENDRLKTLLREVVDHISAQYDPEDNVAMIHRVNAALEGRDADPLP
jgi:hypothetical protein